MRFQKLLEKSKQDMIEKLQGCIQIPSVYEEDDSPYPYGQNVQNCLEYVLNLASSMGFEVHNMDNQVGWCEYGEGEEMVAVLGHLDVVPEGDGWSIPPYEGRVMDGCIYGRGSMDDKGPTVAVLYALKAIKESGLPLKRRIRVLFGVNEETGSADMKYYTSHGGEVPVMGFTPDGEYPVINGEKGLINEHYACSYEQTGALRIKEMWGGTAHNIVPDFAWATLICPEELAQKIAAMPAEKITCTRIEGGVKVEAEGVGAHGGTPWEGENAIGRLMGFLHTLPFEGEAATVIGLLAEKIAMEYDGASMGIALHDEVSGGLTMNLGVLRADETSVEVKLNYRYPVTKSLDDCAPIVKKAFEEAGFSLVSGSYKNSLYMPPESTLVKKLMEVYKECTGLDATPKSIGGGTYAKMLPNVLAFGPIFPGDEVREHKPDEFMEIERLMDNANIYAEAMYALAAD